MSRIAKTHRDPLRTAIGVTPRVRPRGEVTFVIPVTHTWPVPPGVNSFSCVAIAAGGGAVVNVAEDLGAGAGGGLAWANNIPVNEVSVITISPGLAGEAQQGNGAGPASDGGDSIVTVNGVIVCHAGGGEGGEIAVTVSGGTKIIGDGGGDGGDGPGLSAAQEAYASGGGAAGYTGDGADGSAQTNNSVGNAAPPGGGGGSGGRDVNSTGANTVGGSGGVGLFGEGPSGAAGGIGEGGKGGSGGEDGVTATGLNPVGRAGMYGAGGGAGDPDFGGIEIEVARDGAPGAVRIIFGEGRAFPSKDVGIS